MVRSMCTNLTGANPSGRKSYKFGLSRIFLAFFLVNQAIASQQAWICLFPSLNVSVGLGVEDEGEENGQGVANVGGDAGLGNQQVVGCVEGHGKRQRAHDPRKRKHLVALKEVQSEGKCHHAHKVHDADSGAADQHVRKVLRTARQHVAAILKRRKASADADGSLQQLRILWLIKGQVKQHGKKLHDLLDDGRKKDRHVLRAHAGNLRKKAADVRRKKAGHHSRKERKVKTSHGAPKEHQGDRKRHRYTDQYILSIYHLRLLALSAFPLFFLLPGIHLFRFLISRQPFCRREREWQRHGIDSNGRNIQYSAIHIAH